MARHTIFAYKGSRENEQAIGRKLGVHYVLKCSVQRAKNRVRLNVQLIEVSGGRNLWAERYDRELGDIFQIQDEPAARIVSAMEVELAPVDRQRLNSNYIASVEAYDEFLRGLDYHGRRSRDDSLSARAHFRRAIDLDPGRPAVYRLVSGAIHYARGNLEQAAELLKAGAEINPNYQQLRVWLGAVYAAVGRMEEAQWEVEEILTINPDFSLKWVEIAFPFRDPQYRDRFMADLVKAGFRD